MKTIDGGESSDIFYRVCSVISHSYQSGRADSWLNTISLLVFLEGNHEKLPYIFIFICRKFKYILLVFCVLFSYSPSRRARDPFNFMMMMMILYCGTRCLSVLFICYSCLCLSILQYAYLLDTNTLPQGI